MRLWLCWVSWLVLAGLLPGAGFGQRVAEVARFQEPGELPLSQESDDWVIFIEALTSDKPNTWREYVNSNSFDVGLRNGISRTMLHHVAMLGKTAQVEELLKLGADANPVDSLYGHTPLHEAALKGFVDVAQALVANGARLNARAKDGSTPLHIAAGSEQVQMVTYLLKMGANVNARDREFITPLHCAVAASNTEVVQLLLAGGALPDMKSLETWDMAGDTTPLHIAASQGNLEIVAALVDNGASLGLTNRDGQTALNLATAQKHIAVISYLRAKGARY